MATLQQRLAALIQVAKGGQNALRTLITGTASGTLVGLNTAATSIIAAINNVETKADQGIQDAAAAQATADAAATTGGAQINDVTASDTETFSSNKINQQLQSILSQASADTQAQVAAALEGEDLSDIADLITAAAAERSDLATAASVATLATTVGNKANASDVYTRAELGDPDTDLVALWNAA